MRFLDVVEVRAEHRLAHDDVAIHVGKRVDGRVKQWALPVVMQDVTDDFSYTPAPHLVMRPEQAQQLLNDLWRAGFRPTEHHSAGQFEAMQEHIGDLRMVVKTLLPVREVRAS